KQSDFAEVVAPGKIRQHKFAPGMIFTHFDEANSNQVEAVGHVALTADHLSRSKAQQFHAIAEMIDEVLRQRRKYRNALQMSVKSANAIARVQRRTEGFVLLQHIEHIAQHLQADRSEEHTSELQSQSNLVC